MTVVSPAARSLAAVLAAADARLRQGEPAGPRVQPTGFGVLDGYLGGGLRAGDLALLGGPQGFGKTTFALQMLRAAVVAGGAGAYLSYEHDERGVLARLLAMEAGITGGPGAPSQRRVRAELEHGGPRAPLAERLAAVPGGASAVERVQAYAARVFVARGSSARTGLTEIKAFVAAAAEESGSAPFVVVDYLQKVAVPGGIAVEDERVTVVVEGLKDLAVDLEVPIVAVVAADAAGLASARRLRIHHLRGSSALAYEPDVVLVMNDKYDAVARHHLVFDPARADDFRAWAVVSIEKNRAGIDRIDLEFRKRLEQGCFDPNGRLVAEQLLDTRIYVE